MTVCDELCQVAREIEESKLIIVKTQVKLRELER